MTKDDVLEKCREYFVVLSDWYDVEMEINGEVFTSADMLRLIEAVLTPPTPKEEDILEWNRIAK